MRLLRCCGAMHRRRRARSERQRSLHVAVHASFKKSSTRGRLLPASVAIKPTRGQGSGASPEGPKEEVSRVAGPRKRGRNEKVGRGRVRPFPGSTFCLHRGLAGANLVAQREWAGRVPPRAGGALRGRTRRVRPRPAGACWPSPVSAARRCTGPRPSPRAGSPARTAPRSPPSCSPAAARSRRSGTRSSWP